MRVWMCLDTCLDTCFDACLDVCLNMVCTCIEAGFEGVLDVVGCVFRYLFGCV